MTWAQRPSASSSGSAIQSASKRPAGVRIAGTGMSIPPRVMTNDDLSKIVDTNDEWISQRTGIRQRYLVDQGTTLRHIAADALKAALADADMKPTDLDLVIVATITAEMACPSTAARVVADIGATPAGAFDLSAACSGFVYAMNIAESLVLGGRYKTIGVIGAETLSSITDWKNRATCVLFGDGAGAAIVTGSDDENQGCVYQSMNSNGDGWKDLYIPRQPRDVPEGSDFKGPFDTLQMSGREVYKFAVTTLHRTIEQVLTETGLQISDLAMVIPHQSNARILESAREKLGLADDKLCINIDRYGNTSAASVPICLNELKKANKLKKGDLVLFVALGGGLTWTSSLWRL